MRSFSSQDTFRQADSQVRERSGTQIGSMLSSGIGQVGGALKKTNEGLNKMAEKIKNQYILDDADTDQKEKDTINFKHLLKEYRERTESLIPHTNTRVEDVMFIDENHMVALEYVFYNKEGKYFHLQSIENKQSKLGVQNHIFGAVDQENKYKLEHLNAFRQNPKSYEVNLSKDYLDQDMFIDKGGDMSKHDPKSEGYLVQDSIVEAVITLWAVDSTGSISKDQEKKIRYDQRFSPSRNGRMMLFLSQDKKRICLGLVDPLKDDQVQIKAWALSISPSSAILEELEVEETLNENLKIIATTNASPKLQEVNYVNACNHVLLIQKVDIPRYEKELNGPRKSATIEIERERMMQFTIFKASGEQVFQFQNFHEQSSSEDNQYHHKVQHLSNLKFLYMLVMEPSTARQLALKNQNASQELFNDPNDIELVFFFSKIVFNGLSVFNDQNEVATFVRIRLSEIKKNSDSDYGQPLGKGLQEIRYIFNKAAEKYKEYETSNEGRHSGRSQGGLKKRKSIRVMKREDSETPPDFFLIPQKWFCDSTSGEAFPWHDQVQIGTNNTFQHIGFLHKQQRTYLAFDNGITQITNRILGKKTIYDQNIVTHMVRNQQSKRFLYLMTRGMLDGCIAHGFMQKDIIEQVKFHKDHLYSCQDVHAFRGKEGNNINMSFQSSHKIRLQSCTISHGDQQILIKTTKAHDHILHDLNYDHEENVISRKTINQRFSGHFPLIAYNIGLHRVVIQNTQQDKDSNFNSYVFDLDKGEKFISFVEYNSYADIGFVPADLKIEMCSNFVFLVYSKKLKKILIKLLLVDPYYEKYQFIMFTSKRSFSNNNQTDHQDVVIRSIMVSKNKTSLTQSSLDLTLITQFTDEISQLSISDTDHAETEEDDQRQASENDMEAHRIQGRNHVIQIEERFVMAKVPIVQNQLGQIFYVLSSLGNCLVKMINPHQVQTNSKDHATVFELKAQECLAFYINNENQFYFMDENMLIIHLAQNVDTGYLEQKELLMVKDKDLPNLKPGVFSTIIIEDSYLICDSKIFYVQDNKPLENGILDMEDLSLPLMEELEDEEHHRLDHKAVDTEDESESEDEDEVPTIIQDFVIGPIKMRGSNQFLICLKTGQTVNFYNKTSKKSNKKVIIEVQCFRNRIFQLPDTSGVPLISDQEKQVKFSTFLDRTKVLIQIGHRFAIFDEKGHFKCQLEFNKKILPEVNPEYFPLQSVNQDYQKRLSIIFKKNTNRHMELICMSSSNKYFLFADHERKEFRVWQWDSDDPKSKPGSEVSSANKSSLKDSANLAVRKSLKSQISNKSQIQNLKTVFQLVQKKIFSPRYYFTPRYLVEIDKSDLFANPKSKWQEQAPEKSHKDYFKKLLEFLYTYVQVRLADNGATSIILNTQMEHNDIAESVCEKDLNDITIWASIFWNQQLKNIRIEPKTDKETLQIEVTAINEKKRRLGKEIKQKQNEIDIERQYQNSLPSNFQDGTKLKELEDQRDELEHQQQEIINSYILGDYIVVVCGRHVKYAKINTKFKQEDEQEQAKQKQNNKPPKLMKIFTQYFQEQVQFRTLQKMKIEFNRGIEICNVLETNTPNLNQIVAKDIYKRILLVVTWDFEKNNEVSMFQLKYEIDQSPENYIIAGLNQKMNYFFDSSQIYDLQHNIPIQESFKNQRMNQIMESKYAKCRKIYDESSRFLGLEQQNLLNFPLTRMDIKLWSCIADLGNKPQHIRENTELYQLSQTFDNNSLFHHFASYIDVMEMIHEWFKDTKMNNGFENKEENIPLILLSRNKEGKTALDIALETQRLKSFELMLDLLEDKDEFFLTQMMLKNLPQMISMSTELVLKFFQSSVYESPLMEMSDCYPWNPHKKEEIFACHTTFISDEILLHRLANSVGKEAIREHIQNKKKVEFVEQPCFCIECKKNEDDGLNKFKLDVNYDKLNSSKKRIKIEALDLSWVFKDDMAKQFLLLLAESGNSSLYISKSIRVFIKIMWENYQRQMIHYIFMPYVIYFLMFTLLCSVYAGNFLDDNHMDTDINQEELQIARKRLNILACSCVVFMLYFLWVEYKQFREVGLRMYLKDYWNYFDVGSIILNFSFLSMIYLILEHKDAVSETNILGYQAYVQWVRLVGAMNVILMYIKMFYWMRLFKKFAYFITLLSQTISDIKVFLLMLLLVICSFANFFFILNYNTPMNDRYAIKEGDEDIDNSFDSQDPRFYYYVKRYVRNNIISSLISVYLVALGDFDTDGLGQGYYRFVAWVFYLFSTFIVLVVFMNLLIAIMGDSFSRIQPIQEQSALYEQLQLIKDYIWLLDLKHIFEGKKYIVRLYPDVLSGESDRGKTQAVKVNHASAEVSHAIDTNNKNIIEHQGEAEKSIVQILKTLDQQIVKLQYYYENQQNKLMEKNFRGSSIQVSN